MSKQLQMKVPIKYDMMTKLPNLGETIILL